jgi:hypothetical protein
MSYMAGNKFNTEFKPIKIRHYRVSWIDPNNGHQNEINGTALQVIKHILNQQID